MYLIIMGPPGVGKGTEAELLTETFGIPHISTGDIFRALFHGTSEIGKLAKSYIDRGELVPDDVTNEIVRQRLNEPDIQKGFLLDGYPRSLNQAKALEKMLEEKNIKVDAVLDIQATKEILIRRISGRRVCEVCGTVYNVYHKKPLVDGICDCEHGGKLIQREDDMEETVINRIQVYEKQTAPVTSYYEKKGLLVHIDGTQDIEYTHEQVMKVLGEIN